MGYEFNREGFEKLVGALGEQYRIFAPVCRKGAGRFTDVDAVIYGEVTEASQIEFDKKSDYSFKEFLTPLSETLFYFTEEECKEADLNQKPVLIFLRSCDMHAVKRLDQMYLDNGPEKDWFYLRRRNLVQFVLMGCSHSYENCFCVDMGSNKTEDGYVFSVDTQAEDSGEITYRCDLKDSSLAAYFEGAGGQEKEVTPSYVTENEVRVNLPKEVSLDILKDPLWDEYNTRCINCGRCNYVCPTCTCYTMQDVFYTDNGKVGERRRVGASCMVDGYTNVAGGGQYRRKNGERMRFKVLHKIIDYRKRFGYDMCVGCGRCDDVCPEYISFTNIINKVTAACDKKGEV